MSAGIGIGIVVHNEIGDEQLRGLLGGEHESFAAERKPIPPRWDDDLGTRPQVCAQPRRASDVLVCVEDWTEHRKRLSELEHAAEHDRLTGVKNRSGLHTDISRRIKSGRRGCGPDDRPERVQVGER